jgi:hypothetical protein
MPTWSFSSLKQFINCPRQYDEVKLKKNYEVKVSQQMQYGTDVHKALEEYVRDGVELPAFYVKFKNVIDVLLEIPGKRYVEYKMAMREDKTPCGFSSDDFWVRGIVDLMIIDGDTAFIVDYKTGSNKYPDVKQLKLMALMTFAHFPEVNLIKSGLLFVTHNSFVTEDYTRDRIDTYWKSFLPDLARLKIASDTNVWVPNPTPLCGWCPVKTCVFYKEK